MVAEKKKQHFLAQFYMRNWSVDPDRKRISLYAIRAQKHIAAASIRDQAYENYYYGKDGVEDALSEMESIVSPIITKVIASNMLPVCQSEDHVSLLTFVLFQDARTPTKAAALDEQIENLTRTLAKNFPDLKDEAAGIRINGRDTPGISLQSMADICPLVLDLRMKLMVNMTSRPFITSDSPAIRYNQFMEKRNTGGGNTGLGNTGLQIFFPLSPRHMLVLYDGGVYRIGGSSHLLPHSQLTGEDDVRALNVLQAVAADETLYYGSETRGTDVDEMIAAAAPYRGCGKVDLAEHPAIGPDGSMGTLIQTSIPDMRIGLSLSFVGIVPSAAGSRFDGGLVQLRRPDLIHQYESRIMSGGPYDARAFVDSVRNRK